MSRIYLVYLLVVLISSDVFAIPGRAPINSKGKGIIVAASTMKGSHDAKSDKVEALPRQRYRAPSQRTANLLSFWQLAQQKPAHRSPPFERLLGNHPSIQKLDPTTSTSKPLELAKAFYDLRPQGQEETSGSHAKMTSAIKAYLKNKKVNVKLQGAILGYQKQKQRKDSHVKFNAKMNVASNPESEALRRKFQDRKNKSRRELRLRRKQEAEQEQEAKALLTPSFDQLMKKHGISSGLPPIELEDQTSIFLDKEIQGPMATKDFEAYMRKKKYHEDDIRVAMALRVHRVHENFKQHLREENRARIGSRSHLPFFSTSGQQQFNPPTQEPFQSTKSLKNLVSNSNEVSDEVVQGLHQGEWWKDMYND